MIPRNIINTNHVDQAAQNLIAAGEKNNSTKFDVNYYQSGKEYQLAPKKLVSEAFRVATGEAHPVSKFSGGYETNNFLNKLGWIVNSKN